MTSTRLSAQIPDRKTLPVNEQPLTLAEIRRLPKVSLHDHLDGGMRVGTVIDLAQQSGYALPTEDPDALLDWYRACANAGSLVEYLRSDDISTAIAQTADGLNRIAREAVEDLAADGVVYGELRWAPEVVLERDLISMRDAVEAVQAGIEDGIGNARAQGRSIDVGQILCAMRNDSHSAVVANLALDFFGAGVVGFDIAGPELGFGAELHRDAFDLLARNDVPVTVHAGEADGPSSIASALFDGHARRLGHGIRVAEDIRLSAAGEHELGPLAAWVRDRRIILETSPNSNVHTAAIAPWGVELAAHPFDQLYRLGFAVTVNTDNRLTSVTTLSDELFALSSTFGYGVEDLRTFQLTAAGGVFQSPDYRAALAGRINAGFDARSASAH